MKPKKVLFLITKSNWGGAQRYVYDLATHLDKKQYEAVVAFGGDGDLATLLTHAGIRVIKVDSLTRDISLQKEWAFVKELWGILRTERPDVFHVNSSKAGGVGTLLGRLARVPKVVFTAHGWAFNEDRPTWQKLIIKCLHWLTVLLSHKTIAVSRAIVRQLDWPGARKKMAVIHPGRTIGVMYERPAARTKLSDVCPPLATHQQDTWVMTIAELHPIKRLPVLIAAMQQLRRTHPHVISVIIGHGEARERLQALIQKHHLESTVFLTGSITEAARFLKAGDIFVLPSKSESYGYVLHEAGLAELPVIATNVGGITDVVIHNQSGRLIPPDDPTALAQELTDFLTHPLRWKEFAQKHHHTMLDRSVEKMTSKTLAVYHLPLH